ncbi:MAG: ribonuclease III [Leptospiraceae bacterium]|nr:ribonuclease III [Leptospiraceae bacterium]
MHKRENAFTQTTQTLPPQRKEYLTKLLKQLSIPYNTISYYHIALTHKSIRNESPDFLEDNERLEFLGDSVLSLIMTEYLFLQFPYHSEGKLAKMKSYLVSEEVLYQIALPLHLSDYLILGKGESNSGGKDRKSNLANLLEAFLGAIYLDLGLDVARSWILPYLKEFIPRVESQNRANDAKTRLQEYVQKKWKIIPEYILLEENGPDHDKVFTIRVIVKKWEAIGQAKNKKAAEQTAARNLWKKIVKE